MTAGALKESLWRLNRLVDLPRPGWWAVHLAGIALVYALGHLLWR
jgi:hypothetical protein